MLAVAALAVIGGVTLAGCEEEAATPAVLVTLENFTDAEVTAVLGEEFTLPEAKATGTDGNGYDVCYTVKNAAGKQVAVAENTFSVAQLGDYFITCSANVGTVVYTRTITVKVTDESAPEIIFQDVNKGMVGSKYVLPDVIVQDDSKEIITPTVKLYAMDGEEKGEEIAIEEGGFTPTVNGEYLLEATAADSSGNTATETAIAYVREKIRANEVLSFDDETDIDNVGALGAKVSYLQEYENETGVVKFSYTGGYWANQFAFLPLGDVSNSSDIYGKYDTFFVKMYIVQSEQVKNAFTTLGVKDYATNRKYYSSTPVQYNQWVDYQFDIECLKAFDGASLDLSYGAKIFGSGNEALKGTDEEYAGEFYLADLYVAKTARVFREETRSWNGYSLNTYGASEIDSNGGVTLYAGSYSGASPIAMGTADVPYIAFSGNHSAGKTVVVDFTGCNMPNIAFFADQPSTATKNFVGANGLMFCQTVLTKEGEVYSGTSYADKLNVYGPVLFTKYSDTSKKESIYQNLFYPYGDTSYTGVQKDVFMDYETMQTDTTTKYRLLVRFNEGTKISCSAVLMAWSETDNVYKIVYKGARTISQTYETHGLTDGSVIIYGRPYAETKIDKIHTIYSSSDDAANLKTWTGVDVSW